MHFGIDYGAKKAGTTAICYDLNDQLQVIQSQKNKDADLFISQAIKDWSPEYIFIDAPLSLPGAYFEKGDNFFYRKADLDLKAMSPMFLGGLTARAIKLSKELPLLPFYETYPTQIVKQYLPDTIGYKKHKEDIISFLQILNKRLPVKCQATLSNWHQVDAVLAWWAGFRWKQQEVRVYGKKEEGLIYV